MYAYLLNIVCTGKSSKNRFLSSLVRWSAVQSPNLLFTCKTLKQTLHKEWTLDRSNLQLSAQYFLHSHCCKKYDKKYNWLFSSYNPIFKIKVWILNFWACIQGSSRCTYYSYACNVLHLQTNMKYHLWQLPSPLCISINRLILCFWHNVLIKKIFCIMIKMFNPTKSNS